MKIVITKGSFAHWYEDKVGQEFEVIEHSDYYEAYLVKVDGHPSGRYVYEIDCKIVDNTSVSHNLDVRYEIIKSEE